MRNLPAVLRRVEALRQSAATAAVEKINGEADRHPDREALPGHCRQARQQPQREADAHERREGDERRAKAARDVGPGAA